MPWSFELRMDTCNVKVGTMIMDMYCKFGHVDLASVSFREIVKNIKITSNTMINGCLRNEEFERVVKVLDEIFDRDVIIHTTLIDGFIKRDLFDVAFEWFQDAAD